MKTVKIGSLIYEHFCGGTYIGRVIKINKKSVVTENGWGIDRKPNKTWSLMTPELLKTRSMQDSLFYNRI
jgi:hypothetical protein